MGVGKKHLVTKFMNVNLGVNTFFLHLFNQSHYKRKQPSSLKRNYIKSVDAVKLVCPVKKDVNIILQSDSPRPSQ